jgi:hypothetical protein
MVHIHNIILILYLKDIVTFVYKYLISFLIQFIEYVNVFNLRWTHSIYTELQLTLSV